MAEVSIQISWSLIGKILPHILRKIKIDVDFDRTERNPSIRVIRDIAYIKYQLILRTHGWPIKQPRVTFVKVKEMGDILKKTLSPSNFGEIDSSLRLHLHTHEIPKESEIFLNADFEVKVDPENMINKNFMGSDILDGLHPEIEVLCSNNFNFPLDQVPIVVRKDVSMQLASVEVLILDQQSHNTISSVDPRAIRKGDEYVKWHTSFGPSTSILFKVVATWT